MFRVPVAAPADAIIAVSMNVQKYAHNRNQDAKGEPIKHFFKLPLWWAGILMNVFGELGNMFAYGFAPVSLVAPVGSVGVFVNEVIAVTCLGEPFRKRDGIGLLGVVAGVVRAGASACTPAAISPADAPAPPTWHSHAHAHERARGVRASRC